MYSHVYVIGYKAGSIAPPSQLTPPPFSFSNMAAVRKHKRVAASQPGFLPIKSDLEKDGSAKSGRRKRISKNKKKNWNKVSDIHDVEEFLEDVRLQERTTG